MTHDGRRALVALVLTALVLARGAEARACSCTPPPSPADALARAAAVFAGRVTKTEDPATGPIRSSMDPITVTHEISTVWKGASGPSVSVTTARDGASCGFTFAKGEEYLVYASAVRAGLHVSLCSRTRRLANAADDVKALGAGTTVK